MRSIEIEKIDDILKSFKHKSSNGNFVLHEDNESGTLKNVTLTGFSPHCLILKADKANIKMFKKKSADCRCDYIIFETIKISNDGNGTLDEKVAVFIEMKSTVPDADHKKQHPTIQPDGQYEHYVTQLTGGLCLFEYLDSVLKLFGDCNELSKYKKYFVVLYDSPAPPISSQIAPTRSSPPILTKSPASKAKMKKVNNEESLPFIDLIK